MPNKRSGIILLITAPALVITGWFGLTDLFSSSALSTNFHPVDNDAVEPVMAEIIGQSYPTVVIGNYQWLAANLRTDRLPGGTPLPGGYSYNDDPADIETYGLLYTYEALAHIKPLLTDGWRISTDEDWQALELLAGLSTEQLAGTGWRGEGFPAAHFKQQDRLFRWQTGAQGKLNSFGLNVLAAGVRLKNGIMTSRGLYADFWTSSQIAGAQRAYNRSFAWIPFHKGHHRIYRTLVHHDWGFSLRLVRDINNRQQSD